MTDILFRRHIAEDPLDGRRLGRHVAHDPHSKEHPAERAGKVVSVKHRAAGLPLNQGSLGCHDDRTEVLTADGWVRWPDYDGEACLGTVNPLTRQLEYQPPTDLHAYEYTGPLHYADRKRLNFAVTPNHRMWVRPWDQGASTLSPQFEMREMQHVGWYAGLLAAPSGHVGVRLERLQVGSRSYNGDDFLALVALVASDGWVGGTDSNWNTISFCCFREDRYGMVASLAQRLGIHELPSRKGVWKWSDGELAAWLRANLFIGDVRRSPYKRVPTLVKAACAEQVEHFLRFFGDQHQADDRGRQFYTSSSQLADDLQQLLLHLGRRAGMYERDARSTRMADGRQIEAENCHNDITLTEWTTDQLSIDRKKHIAIESYDGVVYCATVPNGLLVTRRNRHVLISGNSCTANALCGALNSEPNRRSGRKLLHERDAVKIYELETSLEGEPYPPNDPGGTGLFVCKAGKQLGLISSYKHAFGIEHALEALVLRPVITGVSWYDSFDQPDATGLVDIRPGASVRGGHEFVADEIDAPNELVWFFNSWGRSWGKGGRFCMRFSTWEALLAERGDVTVPIV